MEKLEWNANMVTGISEIDNQHKRIVDMVNQMREAMEKGDVEAVGRVIPNMVDYTISHFAFEEALMEEAGYRFLIPHRRVHQLFTKRIPEFQARYAAGEDILEELHTMLVRWLANHIQNEDQGYVEAIQTYMIGETEKAAVAVPSFKKNVHNPNAHVLRKPVARRGLWQRIKGLFVYEA